MKFLADCLSPVFSMLLKRKSDDFETDFRRIDGDPKEAMEKAVKNAEKLVKVRKKGNLVDSFVLV